MSETTEQDMLLHAGHGTLLARGLSAEEVSSVQHAWMDCQPRIGTDKHSPTEPTVTLERQDHDWKLHHELMVHTATQVAITAGVGSLLMMHGAALASPGGRVISMAAASGTGKSTATRVLGQQLGYVTDETVMVQPTSLAVTPFPKPLSLFEGTGARPKTQFAPTDLGLTAATGPLELHVVAALDRDRRPEHRVAPCAERLPLADALELLIPQTSSLSRLDRGLVQLAEVLDRVGGAVRLHYSEAEDLVPLVQELLAAPSPTPTHAMTWTALSQELLTTDPVDGERAEFSAGSAPRYQRQNLDDGIALGDGSSWALLHGVRFSIVSGLAPALWALLAVPTTVEDLTAKLTAGQDAPADAPELIHRALNALVSLGLVRRLAADAEAP